MDLDFAEPGSPLLILSYLYMLREVLQHSSAAKYVYFLITLFHHSSFRYLTGEYRTLPSFSIVQMLETSRG